MTSTPSQAGLLPEWCLRLFGRTSGKLTEVPDLDHAGLAMFEGLPVGSSARLQTKDGEVEGTVLAVHGDFVTLYDGKNIRVFPASQLKAYEKLSDEPGSNLPDNVQNSLKKNRVRAQRVQEYIDSTRAGNKIWDKIREPVLGELEDFRKMNKAQRKAYLEQAGREVTEKMKRHFGVKNIGIHYNMHNGAGSDFAWYGGIRAGNPYVAINYDRDFVSMNNIERTEVYFFQTKDMDMATIFGQRHQDFPILPARMGDTIVLINLDKVQGEYPKSGLVTKLGAQEVTFDPVKLLEQPANRHLKDTHGAIGVPSEDLLGPPINVFNQMKARLKPERYLSWDEQSLAALRFLEAKLGL